MADFNGLRAWAEENYELENNEDTWFALVFEFDDGRTQKVAITHFTAYGHEWVELRSPICEEGELPHRVALKKSAEMAVGAICLHDGRYYVMFSVLLDDLSVEEFEIPLLAVATAAEDFEKSYSSGDDSF